MKFSHVCSIGTIIFAIVCMLAFLIAGIICISADLCSTSDIVNGGFLGLSIGIGLCGVGTCLTAFCAIDGLFPYRLY